MFARRQMRCCHTMVSDKPGGLSVCMQPPVAPGKLSAHLKALLLEILVFRRFPIHLENYPEYFEDNELSERALRKTQVTSIFWVISKMANEVGCQCKIVPLAILYSVKR